MNYLRSCRREYGQGLGCSCVRCVRGRIRRSPDRRDTEGMRVHRCLARGPQLAASSDSAAARRALAEDGQALQVDAHPVVDRDEDHEHVVAGRAADDRARRPQVDRELADRPGIAAVPADSWRRRSSRCRRPRAAGRRWRSRQLLPSGSSRCAEPLGLHPLRRVAGLHQGLGHRLDEAGRAADVGQRHLGGRPRHLGQQGRVDAARVAGPAWRLVAGQRVDDLDAARRAGRAQPGRSRRPASGTSTAAGPGRCCRCARGAAGWTAAAPPPSRRPAAGAGRRPRAPR